MRYKTHILIDLKELDELLSHKDNDPIWRYKVRSKWSLAYLFSNVLIAGFCIYYFNGVFNILISLLSLIPYIIVANISNTMKYTILANRITFEWGFLEKRIVDIPFRDINAINLVEYHDSEKSTIYFGTKGEYKIKKMNFDENESRAHITFENVLNGQEIIKLLNLLWERSKTSN